MNKVSASSLIWAATALLVACAGPGAGGSGVGPLPDLGDDAVIGQETGLDSTAPGPDATVDGQIGQDAETDTPGELPTDATPDAPAGDVLIPDIPADTPAPDVPTDTPIPDVPTDTPTPDVPTDTPTPDIPADTPTSDVPAETEVSTGDTTIPMVQQQQGETCDPASVVSGAAVTLLGVVATSPVHQVSASLEAIYAADPSGASPWGGVFITAPLGAMEGVIVGTAVDVTGTVEEYFCNTQIAAVTVQVSGTGTVPAPTVLTAPSEPYEGMLVTLESVTVLSNVAGGLWDVGSGFLVENDFGFFLSLADGETYTVTGQLKYSFEQWRVVPRSIDDVVFEGTLNQTSIASIQQSSASVDCTVAEPVTIDTGLVVEGTISVAQWDISSSLHGYHLTSGSGAYESISLNVPKTLATNFAPGDRVRVTGDHIEFYCLSQLSATAVEPLNTVAGPAPITLSVSELANNAEAWEGAVITVSGLVTGTSPNFDAFGDIDTTTIIGTEPLLIDDAIVGGGAYSAPAPGVTVTVTGALRYAFDAYRITPRDLGDISW